MPVKLVCDGARGHHPNRSVLDFTPWAIRRRRPFDLNIIRVSKPLVPDAETTPAANPPDRWTVRRILEWTTSHLQKHGSETPRLDAEILLSHSRRCPRVQLYVQYDQELTERATRDHARAGETPGKLGAGRTSRRPSRVFQPGF